MDYGSGYCSHKRKTGLISHWQLFTYNTYNEYFPLIVLIYLFIAVINDKLVHKKSSTMQGRTFINMTPWHRMKIISVWFNGEKSFYIHCVKYNVSVKYMHCMYTIERGTRYFCQNVFNSFNLILHNWLHRDSIPNNLWYFSSTETY